MDFALIDLGLIIYLLSFLPSTKCNKCLIDIDYWDESYLTIPKNINGKIENLIYCSRACSIDAS